MANERILNWMEDRPVLIRVADQAVDFTVTSYQVTPYGMLVDVPVNGGARFIRRFVPWQQLTYMQQDITPVPGPAPVIPQQGSALTKPPGDASS